MGWFGKRSNQDPDWRIKEVKDRWRQDELARDPSSIPGMTQTELNEVIDTGSIPTSLLNEILDQ